MENFTSLVPKTDLFLKLQDGRHLGFAEYGVPHGKPVLFFHGLTGNRFDAALLHQVALSNNCRLVSIDRPGIGISSMDKKRSILSWVDDVEALTDYLGVKKFSIIGHSGGAPFTVACAYKIPDQLNGVAIVAGIGPVEIPEVAASLSQGQRFLNNAINTMPWITRCMMKLTSIMFNNPGLLKYGLKQMPEVDIFALQSQESHEELAARMMETFRQGIVGASLEMQLILKPWGFDLTQIKLKCPITIWQGGFDKQVPVAHAEIYARLISNAKLHFFKQEGHISLLTNKGKEILQSIC
jgi:pimeloyl-ACP methyl ester carboxylesterase